MSKKDLFDANSQQQYQKQLERIVGSLIRKYEWLDAKSEMYRDDIAAYVKLVDALTKVSAHIRDFLKMAGVRIDNDNDLALLLARIKDQGGMDAHEK